MIFINKYFEYVFKQIDVNYTVVNDITDIPHNCKLIAWSFLNSVPEDEYYATTHSLVEKTKYLIIDLNEFVDYKVCSTFERTIHSQYPNVTIFSNVIPNYPSRLKFSGAWLTFFENVYKTNTEHSWAESKINALVPSTETKPKKVDCLLGLRRDNREFIKSKFICSDREQFVFSYYETNKNIIPFGSWGDVLNQHNDIKFSGDCITMQDGNVTLASNVIPVDIYNQTYFSIVAETNSNNHYNFYTEKIVKPMVGQRLFVVFAGRHYLKNLRSLGFRTFDSVIDESYDDIDDPICRWEQAWNQIEYLLTQDPISINKQIKEIVQHNYDLYRNTCWHSGIVDCIKYAISN